MGKDISDLSIKNLNSIFLEKIKDYISIMSKCVSLKEIEQRKNIIVGELDKILGNYNSLKEELKKFDSIDEAAKENIKIASEIDDKKSAYERESKKISALVNDEIEFLHFFTTDFSSENKDHGVRYTEPSTGEVLYKGVDTAATYSIINTLAFTKQKNNEPFNYPKKMEVSDDDILTYYQVKDRITLDMLDIFGDNFMRYYFLGQGKEYNQEMMKLFVSMSKMETIAIDDIIRTAYYENENLSYNDAVEQVAIENRSGFNKAVDKSIESNDESYCSFYDYFLKNATKMVKEQKYDVSEDLIEKKNKGLK